MAVHGSGKNTSLTDRRVAILVRYFGGDATWRGRRTRFPVLGATDDIFTKGSMPMNDELFSIIWQNQYFGQLLSKLELILKQNDFLYW